MELNVITKLHLLDFTLLFEWVLQGNVVDGRLVSG